MKPASIFLKAIAVGAAISRASGLISCPLGTRVYSLYSLTVWSGWWLDGLMVRCTGDSDEHYIPEKLNDSPGGGEDEGFCAGTAGVQSAHWNLPNAAYGLVYLNITCLDNETYQFTDGSTVKLDNGGDDNSLHELYVRPAFDFWDVNRNRAISCNDREHVQGLTCSFDYVEDSGYTYFLTDLDVVLLSSALGEHETSTAH